MKIACCDDNKSHVLNLIQMLMELYPALGLKDYYEFSNAEDLLEKTAKGVYFDVVFLDVEMDGVDGVEAGRRLRNQNEKTIIIFVSAYPRYAIPAYDCEPLYFLVKPVEKDRLQEVWNKVLRKYNMYHQYYVVKHKGRVVRIPITEILYVEVLGKQLYFHTTTDVYETRGTLADVFDEIQHHGFCYTYHGFIVNMNHIREIGDTNICLSTGEKIILSVRRKSELMQFYAEFIDGR